ncbi:MAG: hypothetical protein AAF614_13885 [Chloroflexota bacterium]
MNEQTDQLTYAAIVTISLPGDDKTATAAVKLLPADQVETNGRSKPLSDCTLADLRVFGEQWEADVWETYQTIRLMDLHEDQTVDVNVTMVGDEEGALQPDLHWEKTAVVLVEQDNSSEGDHTIEAEDDSVDEPEVDTSLVTIDEDEADDEEASFVAEMADEVDADEEAFVAEDEAEETAEAEADEAAQATTPAETAVPIVEIPSASTNPLDRIVVKEPEPVFEEVKSRDPEAQRRGQTTTVTESQARVRVAGKRLPLGHRTWAATDILMDETALRASQAHALSSLNREVAGVLVGPRPEKQPDGRYLVHIIDTIEAKYTVMNGASVTYTPESWRYLNDTLNEKYPNETAVMVGWYHTHPGFGIFLSGMDLFIHQNFFTQIWHVAMVLDPRARTSGFFCWDRRKTRVSRYDFAWPHWAAGSW